MDAAAVAVEYGMVAAGTLTKNVPPVARWSEADQMCSIIEPNHSKLNLIGAPVVTAAYTDASPLLATDEESSLAANEPGAARAAAPSVARAAKVPGEYEARARAVDSE